MLEKINFYYTNDLHSHFDHWSRVATFMKMKRLESEERDESYWVVDIGDHIDRVHPITEATMGKANVGLLNDLQYDFVTIGNNEGLTLAHNDLYHLYNDATFEVIVSNLQCTKSENPLWLSSHKIVESKGGVRIGILGLTVPYNPYYNLLGWHIEPIFPTLEKQLAVLREQTDVIVLLSHLGIYEDERIANHFSDIDVIIGGHTHHLLRTGELVNNTLLTAAGKQCAHVGEVTITYNHRTKSVVGKNAKTTEVELLHRDLRTEQRIGELQEQADVILAKQIINVDKPIKVNWFQETEIMKQFTKQLQKWTGADGAFLNAGMLLDEFPAGEITYYDVHRNCPHPINPCVVTLTGADLQEVAEITLSIPFMELKLRGFGFRGEILGRMVFSGFDVQTYVDEMGNEIVEHVLFQGKPIQENETYQLVTADTFTFGRLLPPVAQAEKKELFLPEFLREVLVYTLIHYKSS